MIDKGFKVIWKHWYVFLFGVVLGSCLANVYTIYGANSNSNRIVAACDRVVDYVIEKKQISNSEVLHPGDGVDWQINQEVKNARVDFYIALNSKECFK